MIFFLIYSCNSTKKVPEGKFLLTKNNFEFTDKGSYNSTIPDLVSQKPNKKDFLMLFPMGLWKSETKRLIVHKIQAPRVCW